MFRQTARRIGKSVGIGYTEPHQELHDKDRYRLYEIKTGDDEESQPGSPPWGQRSFRLRWRGQHVWGNSRHAILSGILRFS